MEGTGSLAHFLTDLSSCHGYDTQIRCSSHIDLITRKLYNSPALTRKTKESQEHLSVKVTKYL